MYLTWRMRLRRGSRTRSIGGISQLVAIQHFICAGSRAIWQAFIRGHGRPSTFTIAAMRGRGRIVSLARGY
jgi:hypothetical protein